MSASSFSWANWIHLFFIAGRDTTAVLLMWTSYFLTMNPEAEKELRAEVDEVLGGKKNEFSNSRYRL
jgi:cytochrome P450